MRCLPSSADIRGQTLSQAGGGAGAAVQQGAGGPDGGQRAVHRLSGREGEDGLLGCGLVSVTGLGKQTLLFKRE